MEKSRRVRERPADQYTLSTSEAAKIVGVSAQRLTKFASNGGIDYVKRGFGMEKLRYFFHPDDVARLAVSYATGKRPKHNACRKPVSV